MRVLVTGSAGFIGFHVARRLLADGHEVSGIDGLTPYYDVALKRQRLALLERQPRFEQVTAMLGEGDVAADLFERVRPELVLHFAAQAGVRYSIEQPDAYMASNIDGSYAVLEAARRYPPRHLMLASTSSVYGGHNRRPSRESDNTDLPLTLYAATKKSMEALSHAYAHLWSIPTTCVRLFTVYGPWGRPDMALYRFAEAMAAGRPIDVYGEGRMRRDFTFIDDVVESIARLAAAVPGAVPAVPGGIDTLSPVAPWRVVNVGGGRPVELLEFIRAIERHMGREARLNLLPMQAGDVRGTAADPALLRALVGFVPGTSVDAGVAAFVDWYRGWKR